MANPLLQKLVGWLGGSPPKSRLLPGDRPRDRDSAYDDPNPYEQYYNQMLPPEERRRRYDTYDELDELSDVSTILDAYAEDATQYDREKKASIWIEAKDEQVKAILEEMLKRVDAQGFQEAITRDVAKYGDDFAILNVQKGVGITGWDWVDPRSIERIENRQGDLLGFEWTERLESLSVALKRGEKPQLTFKPWEVLHFRLFRRKRVGKQNFRNIYGTSILAGSTRIGKQVKILDDMLMVRRLVKTFDTRVYKIDTAKSSVAEEIQILKRWKNAMKRKAYVDPANGRLDVPFDPMSWQEDVFWPIREGSDSSVDIIPGQPNVGDIVDIEHFRDKFFGSMRAPKGYFGYEGDINAKATLASQDMKWGRTVNSLQKAIKNGFYRLCQIELALHEIDPMTTEFTVGMVVPSVLEDLSRLDAMQSLIDIAERLASLGETLGLEETAWRLHILRAVLGLSDEEIERFTGDGEEPTGDPDKPEIEKVLLGEMMRDHITRVFRRTTQTADDFERARPSELPDRESASSHFDPQRVTIEVPKRRLPAEPAG